MVSLSTQLQASADQSGKVKIVSGYALQQRLGSGSFATVYKGVKVPSSKEDTPTEPDVAAIKAITRTSEKLTKKVLENLEMEISILRTYKHPNIVCLHDVQKTERHFYLMLEYCGGGDLQKLIRTRKAGRVSERLSRRLMKDLAAGLKFLWSQELIHRDIKPQNLLLTGSLPLDEKNDPAKMDVHEEMRQQENFPSSQFALKIADFGFARHLQTTSLAETLCGSPLYMAPEILQHHRYDAKADLWSVGTVLFEMIAGKPPFNGANHIDLLRNIQRKAVRLPTDVRVSKECVNLLRILLNRNPLSRAGFKQFFEACDAFVALGCEGPTIVHDADSRHQPSMKMDLGTIHEDKGHGAGSIMTVETEAQSQIDRTAPASSPQLPQSGFVTPPLGPVPTPPAAVMASPLDNRIAQTRQPQQINARFAPLQPSPPQAEQSPASTLVLTSAKSVAPVVPSLDSRPGQIQLTTFNSQPTSVDSNGFASQNSSEDSEFVMVEHGVTNRSGSSSPSTSRHSRHQPCGASQRYSHRSPGSHRGGMLSTSPGTGGMLVGLMMGSRPRLLQQHTTNVGIESEVNSAGKIIAASEDVGRRAVSVAHLGDTRAYISMRHLVGIASGSSLLSTSPMEGVEESIDDRSSTDITDCDEGSAQSMEVTNTRKRLSSVDKVMTDSKIEEDDDDVMPFAIPAEQKKTASSFAPIPTRLGTESLYQKNAVVPFKSGAKGNPQLVREYFREALSCYLKALSMIKSVLGAVQKVKSDLEGIKCTGAMNADNANRVDVILKRCDITAKWLSGQFTGVLERADAANGEISKLSVATPIEGADNVPSTNVNKLIYNHSLACGRDAAVKQLLGQFETSRSCYRTAGLLVETLLMEPNVGVEDKKILEGYVDGFSTRINDLDSIIQQNKEQNRRGSLENSSISAARQSGVIGIIGGIPNSAPKINC